MRFFLNWLLTSIAIAIATFLVPGIAPPLTCLTVGLFQLVVNSFMLELASWLSVNLLGSGISIAGFGSALIGSIIVSIMCTILGVVTED